MAVFPFLASNFLVPNATIIVEVGAFILTLAVLAIWVLPRVDGKVKERQAIIKSSLDAASEAKKEAEEIRKNRDTMLSDARDKAREIVAQANRTADQLRTDGEHRGQAEFERLVAAAESEIERARLMAIDELSARMGELAMSLAARVVAREIDPERHRDLVEESVAAFRATGMAGESVRQP
ncbi:MAG: F0F1 ATP synthase subunit B [Actinobacteria bacterium]|nr:F0F1 ATP synthase subunit B [Actinomycetota bacterium]MCL5447298.1 F0F1 ATP synthase subunit B [Actinomycetota bacterium]